MNIVESSISQFVNKLIIIHIHSLNCSGIADFLKSVISLYTLCKKLNIEYYIDLSYNQNLNKCFITKKIPDYIKNLDYQYINIIDKIYSQEKINEFLEIISNNPKVYYLYTNCCGFGDINEISLNIHEINKKIIYPSEFVINHINYIYSKYNISENNYISFHIRCGDYNMSNNINNINKHIFPDNRINVSIENIININEYLNNLKLKYNLDLKIIIHSDSQIIKDELYKLNNNYLILDIDIQHVSNSIGSNTNESFISTIAEFYIMSKAHSIFMIKSYSGFSHMATVIGKNQLYTSNNNFLYNYLGPDNLIYL